MTSPQLICDVTRTRGISIVTSYSSICLARANWRKCNRHQWTTTVNINRSSTRIHGSVCTRSNKSFGWYQFEAQLWLLVYKFVFVKGYRLLNIRVTCSQWIVKATLTVETRRQRWLTPEQGLRRQISPKCLHCVRCRHDISITAMSIPGHPLVVTLWYVLQSLWDIASLCHPHYCTISRLV